MKKKSNKIMFLLAMLIASSFSLLASNDYFSPPFIFDVEIDTSLQDELAAYWNALSRTVREGDYEGYGALYHEDAVVVFATSTPKRSLSIAEALAGWKSGFDRTKSGKAKSNVTFRFSDIILGEDTAHETGIFHYTSYDSESKEETSSYVHFEMLLVKKDGNWLGLMELQKSRASEEEWNSLK